MSYQITITKTQTVKCQKGHEWTTIGTKEVKREASMFDPHRDDESLTRIEEVRGYTPWYESEEEKQVEILKQTVDELDLAAVIRAVNKL